MSLKEQIDQFGRFPPIELRIKPLASPSDVVVLYNFLSYSFDSNMLIPVDTFSFTFAIPADVKIWSDNFREGDIAQLYAGGQLLATGIIDSVDVEVDADHGERITVTGRDLMGQLEDQDAVSLDSRTIFGEQMTIDQVFKYLQVNTRFPRLRKQQTADIDAMRPAPLFATSPGESKLAALSRYLEPLNCIAWCDPDGTLVIGRPNMAQDSSGVIAIDHRNRWSNAMAIKASFSSATIPNIILPVWVGQETVQERVAPEQAMTNVAFGPARLLTLKHRLAKCVIVSSPTATNPQGFSDVNRFRVGGATLLQAYAKREIARQNVKEVLVQALLPGHLDNDGSPLRPDRVWVINFTKAFPGPIDLYCFGVQYRLDQERGQTSTLQFTKKGTIVSDVRVQQ